jgi:hypothetical protein
MADVSVFLQDNSSISIFTTAPWELQFTASHHKKVTSLLEKRVFEITKLENVPPLTCLFNSQFVDEVKHKRTTQTFEKSRLVIQTYNDTRKEVVLTQLLTIQQISQQLILCIAVIMDDKSIHLYLCDISQAYVQSTTELNCDFYI